jgi:hypothetical protein
VLSLALAEPGSPYEDILLATSSAAAAPEESIVPQGTGDLQSTTATSAPIHVLQLEHSQLEVVVADAPAAGTSYAAGAVAAPVFAPVDLSKVVDTSPPVLNMVGAVYMEVLEQEQFTDPGVIAHDNIDGSRLLPTASLQLCQLLQLSQAAHSASATSITSTARLEVGGVGYGTFNCTGPVPLLDTSKPTVVASGEDSGTISSHSSNTVYVISYNVRDAAGNAAVPLKRYVAVAARCASPERWCSDLAACSVNRVCSSALVHLALPAASSSSSGISGGSSSSNGGISSSSSVSNMDDEIIGVEAEWHLGWLLGSPSWKRKREYTPPIDKTPPRLKLLGKGNAAITTTGSPCLEGSA